MRVTVKETQVNREGFKMKHISTSKQWHDERRRGIGGSEWKDVLSVPPYGCERRLWYEKRGVPADYQDDQGGVKERGHVLESIVADEFSFDTKLEVMRETLLPDSPHLPEWWIGNIDYMIRSESSVEYDGILDCKTKGQWSYSKFKKDGLSLGEIAQLNHYMAMYGFTWGYVSVLWPDGWEREHVRLERDDELIENMRQAGSVFWDKVESGDEPDKLEAKDRRCQSCRWRHTCHDVDVLLAMPDPEPGELEHLDDDDLYLMCLKRDDINQLVSEAKAELATINGYIKEHLGAPRKIDLRQGYRITYASSQRVTIDSKQLKKDMPEVAAKYSKVSETISLKINKT